MSILVTGALGNVGKEAIWGLKGKASFRAAVRRIEEARTALGDDVELVKFDFLKPETFAAAFDGIETVFLVRPPALSNVKRDIAPAIHTAAQAGVKRMVFLSIQGVEHNPIVPHYKIEAAVRESGMAWTFLRASFFMQNLSTTHRQEIASSGEIVLPVGRAKTSFIDVRDIAAVAVKTLTEAGQENHAYTLTGGEALDYYEVAEIMSDVLGRHIRYANPSVLSFVQRQTAAGRPLGYTLVMTALYTITRLGNAAQVTWDTQALLGRAPITMRQFVADYRACWMSEASSEISRNNKSADFAPAP